MNTERETILRQLAEFDFPEWCEWVSLDVEGVGVFPSSPELIDNVYCIDDDEHKTNTLTHEIVNKIPYLFPISEINQAKEEVRADLKEDYDKILNVNCASDKVTDMILEILGIDWIEGCGPEKQNDWYNRETIQANINSMFPDRPQEEYKCDQCRFETISKSMMIEHYHKVHESRVSSSMMFGEYGSLIK